MGINKQKREHMYIVQYSASRNKLEKYVISSENNGTTGTTVQYVTFVCIPMQSRRSVVQCLVDNRFSIFSRVDVLLCKCLVVSTYRVDVRRVDV